MTCDERSDCMTHTYSSGLPVTDALRGGCCCKPLDASSCRAALGERSFIPSSTALSSGTEDVVTDRHVQCNLKRPAKVIRSPDCASDVAARQRHSLSLRPRHITHKTSSSNRIARNLKIIKAGRSQPSTCTPSRDFGLLHVVSHERDKTWNSPSLASRTLRLSSLASSSWRLS